MASEWAQRIDELAARYRAGEPVMDELYQEAYSLARAIIHQRGWFLPGGERDDLEQEGIIGFWQAVQGWDPDAGYRFASFAGMCMTRKMRSALRGANYPKRRILNDAIRIDAPIRRGGRDDDPLYLIDMLESPFGDPERCLIDLEERREEALLVAGVLQGLSALEREALLRVTWGQSYTEAARAMGTSPKAVDNALQRARRKLLRRREAMSA